MLMTVLGHRYHQWAELRNQQPVTYHKLGGDPELFRQKGHSMPKAAPTLAAAPSTSPASNSNIPVAVHNFSVPTISLPIWSTGATVTVHDDGGPKKERSRGNYFWQMAPTNRTQMFENELQKWSLSFFAISQNRYAVEGWSWGYWMYWRAQYLSIYHRKTNTRLRESWFQDCKRTLENPHRKLQETNHHIRRQSSVGEDITYRQTDCLDDLRRLQNLWRQRSHLGHQRLSKVQLNNDNVQAFDTKWDEVWSAVTARPTDNI